jgi:hypothetical protein
MRAPLVFATLCLLAQSASAQAPRPIAPISGTYILGGRPHLRWTHAPGATAEVCADRACRHVITSVTGDDGATDGRTVRVWGPNTTRSAIDLVTAGVGDVDGDGFDDFAMRPINPTELTIFYGRPASHTGAWRSTTLRGAQDTFYFGGLICGVR